jgi:hypothetical protein
MSTETDLVRGCIDLLGLMGVVAIRINNGSVKIGRRFVRFTDTPGVSDILACLPGGRFLAVECKRGRNRPSPDQHRFLRLVHEAGGATAVVYSVDDLEDELQELGISFDPVPVESMDDGEARPGGNPRGRESVDR